ncbi:unnamed protein product, partial [Trichobilharzia regenti]
MATPKRTTVAEEGNKGEETQNSAVNALPDLRLPQFDLAEPRVWFAIIEQLFAAR